MSEIIEEMMKTQKTWMYLEPIFASEDIGKTMPNEAFWFNEVDQLWKREMDSIKADPGIIDLIERDSI